MSNYKLIDLFAGCGGLLEGFLQSERFVDIASVEWQKPMVDTLRHRIKSKWNAEDVDSKVMHFDIQREEELYYGWDDEKYGSNPGLDYFINKSGGIDVIIGGPPCQAYSIAGRVRDENGMRNDYRNYLFEHYINIVDRYKPKLFIFENVPGMLSAMPDGTPITSLIRDSIEKMGYEIVDDLKKYAVVNASHYGVPQNRKRVIILGISKDAFHTKDRQHLIKKFYTELLPKYKSDKILTVKDAIDDLPKCTPIFDENLRTKRKAYIVPECEISWHKPRYHNLRDMKIYKMLAEDIESGEFKYTDSTVLTEIYEKFVGSKSPIHRYHVLRPDQPSTTIIAHLYKDGHRYIHYDSSQARTITPREAARLQSFPDDFEFIGSQGHVYQMIGNAVPPKLAECIASAVADFLDCI